MKRIFIIFLMIIVSYPVMVVASAGCSEDTKIAVAATGQTVEASVSNMAAKSPYYLIFNKKGELIEAIDNPYKNALKGAGFSAANFLAQKNVAIIVAGSFGLKMINTLKSRGITDLEFNGNVKDALKKALKLN